MSFEYFDKIKEIIEVVEAKETETLKAAIDLMTKTILDGKTIYAFGASHAGIITQEVFYRAGGLALINPIFAKECMVDAVPITQTSAMESLEGYGTVIAQSIDFQEADMLLVHSVSGRNPIAIDIVLAAKEKGVKVVSITNVKYSKETKSRHSSGLRLYEISDIVIDNHGKTGDAVISIEGCPQTVGASSTVIGALIANTLVVETVRNLVETGMDPLPIFYSANIDGGRELNDKMIDNFRDRIKYQF